MGMEVRSVRERLRGNGIQQFAVSPGVLGWLAGVGYEPAYGARPVRRAVRQYVLNPLAQQLLGHEDDLEGARVAVDLEDGQIRIRVASGKAEPARSDEASEQGRTK